jgi:sialidase-1
MLNLRNEAPEHRRAVSLSADSATGWSAPTLDEALIEPICFASLVRLPGAGDRLAFVNPACDTPAHPGRPHGSFERRNLTLRLSADGGRTWPAQHVLDPGWAGYADLAALPDGTLLCLYERGALTRMTDIAALTLVRMEPDALQGM